MKRDKALIVTAIGLAVALIITLLNFFDPYPDENAWRYVYLVVSPIWAFSVVPSYVFCVLWFKASCERQTMEQAVRSGLYLGLMFGFELIILPIIAAPVMAVVYYVNVFKGRKQKDKNVFEDIEL